MDNDDPSILKVYIKLQNIYLEDTISALRAMMSSLRLP